LLGLQSLIFLAWAVMMFRTIFGHRKRAALRTGRTIPGVGDTLREWSHWWRSDELRTERRILIVLTALLVLSILSGAYFAVPSS